MTLAEMEAAAIQAALVRHGGRKPDAAKELGIALKTLYNKLNRMNGTMPPTANKVFNLDLRLEMQPTESSLVATMNRAAFEWRWVVGELAEEWYNAYARHRTMTDLSVLVGLTPEDLRICWNVYQRFANLRDSHPNLGWRHFKAALAWKDLDSNPMPDGAQWSPSYYPECGALECLRWANETISTTAEMRAWRRAQHGEDLSIDETT